MLEIANALPHSYDYRLVALSILIAILAAHTALDLAGRTAAAKEKVRIAWLSGGAAAMGLGIWSMHYVGMLALNLPVPVLYDLPTVLLSLLAAVGASAVALYAVSGKQLRVPSIVLASLAMGTGISAMHYIGMAAMRLPAECHYDSSIVAASVVIAIVVSAVAMLLSFRFRQANKILNLGKLASAVLMGLAVAAMHYTGMAAVFFTPAASSGDLSNAISVSSLGIAGITFVALLVFAVVAVTSVLDRKLSANARQLVASKSVIACSSSVPSPPFSAAPPMAQFSIAMPPALPSSASIRAKNCSRPRGKASISIRAIANDSSPSSFRSVKSVI